MSEPGTTREALAGVHDRIVAALISHEPDGNDCGHDLVCSNTTHLAAALAPEVARIEAEAREAAWDEGYTAGWYEAVAIIEAEAEQRGREGERERIAAAIEEWKWDAVRDEEPGNWKRGARHANLRAVEIARSRP